MREERKKAKTTTKRNIFTLLMALTLERIPESKNVYEICLKLIAKLLRNFYTLRFVVEMPKIDSSACRQRLKA